jgi:hypothetical protein
MIYLCIFVLFNFCINIKLILGSKIDEIQAFDIDAKPKFT